jgi:hypothetical protein
MLGVRRACICLAQHAILSTPHGPRIECATAPILFGFCFGDAHHSIYRWGLGQALAKCMQSNSDELQARMIVNGRSARTACTLPEVSVYHQYMVCRRRGQRCRSLMIQELYLRTGFETSRRTWVWLVWACQTWPGVFHKEFREMNFVTASSMCRVHRGIT